ncbi:RNA recognition motif [Rhizoctonia solani]|uniref:RNA recognition motif n=1 Tax=Rhizoctonia solani TaxID=456999 RepID=A0A8H7M709_9AGAM|nr:RNA recognition motif [Rhizoctonia solani]
MAGFDSELDALFKSSVNSRILNPDHCHTGPNSSPSLRASTSTPTKRKHEKKVGFTDQSGAKRRKPNRPERQAEKKKSKDKDDSAEEDDAVVEDAYHQGKATVPNPTKPKTSKLTSPKAKPNPDAPPPLHESLTQKPEAERPRKKKYVPEGETPDQRDARTIFIGNLPASVAKSSAKKSLHKHILNCLTTSYPDLARPAIESSRFRSVAFKTPTAKLPSDTLSSNSKSKPNTSSSEHNRNRAAEWRATQDPEDATHKIFQTPAQKKKTAYITGALHDSAKSSSSAYVVFAHPNPVEGSEPAWDPTEVAARAVIACNGSKFMERVLRVDRVGKREEDKQDPRTMIFVGNLDFETDEDALREMFENLVEKERGKSDAQGDDSDSESHGGQDDRSGDESEEESGGEESGREESGAEGEADEKDGDQGIFKPTPATDLPVASKRWVKSVRIIRDKDTQLGKGFGYVQFIDRASVDEILALEPGTIKLAKRKLRVQRCKTIPGVSLPKTKPSSASDKPKEPKIASKGESNQKSDRQKARPTPSKPILLALILTLASVSALYQKKNANLHRLRVIYRSREPLLITMCLAFWTLAHPRYALIIAANRDEFLSRPTIPANWHNFDDSDTGDKKYVLSGRDAIAGGTWLGINRKGDVALLTNITEPVGKYSSSRGELTSNFLTLSPTTKPRTAYHPMSRRSYLNNDRTQDSIYSSPAPRSPPTESIIVGSWSLTRKRVEKSQVDLSQIGSNEWPKVSEGRKLFDETVNLEDLDDDGLIEALCQIMSVENPKRPTTRYGLRMTISVPPIPVEPGAWSKTINPSSSELPASADAAPALSSENRKDYYGTRLTSVILVRRDGRATFVERDVWVQQSDIGEPVKCSGSGSQRRFDFDLKPGREGVE